jgi:hypothetical protein
MSDAYRREFATMRGRADFFIGFPERGLSLSAPEGRLAFICADRWLRNQYGARLPDYVGENYAVDSVLVMHDVDAFEHPVAAYPASPVLRNGPQRGRQRWSTPRQRSMSQQLRLTRGQRRASGSSGSSASMCTNVRS